MRLFLAVTIALFGFIGNIFVCIIMTRQSHMNSAMSSFIRNLAVADLCILLFNFPFAVVREQHPFRWYLGEFTCLYVFPFCEAFFGVSIWSITAIAIERYRSIAGSLSLVHYTTARTVNISLVFIWTLSFLIVAFPLILHMKFEPVHKVCYVKWPGRADMNPISQLYTITEIIFWFLLPLIVISWTYYKISRRIRLSREFHEGIQQQLANPQQVSRCGPLRSDTGQNIKAKKILTPLVIAFVATMLPPHAFRLLIVYLPTLPWSGYYLILYNIFVIFTITNSAVNPLIYCAVSREFRQRMRQLVTKCCVRQDPRSKGRKIHPVVTFTVRNHSATAGTSLQPRAMSHGQQTPEGQQEG